MSGQGLSGQGLISGKEGLIPGKEGFQSSSSGQTGLLGQQCTTKQTSSDKPVVQWEYNKNWSQKALFLKKYFLIKFRIQIKNTKLYCFEGKLLLNYKW